MHMCVVAPPGECLRVKADMVLFAGNTVWFISEHIRDIREGVLYKSTLTLPLVPQIRLMSTTACDYQFIYLLTYLMFIVNAYIMFVICIFNYTVFQESITVQ